jgi:beta-lactam-binding protein with PASTA domain
VSLFVLANGSSFPVPSVKGDTPTAASVALGADTLTVSSTQGITCSNNIAQGDVVKTNPPAQSLVQSGTPIELILSSGYCPVTVPLVSPDPNSDPPTPGDTQTAATNAITAAGLVPNYVYGSSAQCTPTGPFDEVIAQSPAGGTTAPYQSSVTLTYCPPAGGPSG